MDSINVSPQRKRGSCSPLKILCLVLVGLVLLGVGFGAGVGAGFGIFSIPGLNALVGGYISPPTPVTMSVVVAGDVSDFTLTMQEDIKEKVANEVGVSATDVSLLITPGSARLSFEIRTPSSSAADAAVSTLTTALATPTAASTFLSTTSAPVTVETIETAPVKVTESPPPSPAPTVAFPTGGSVPTADVTTDVLIIGAGMAGIAAGKSLTSANIDFIILEGTDRVGGRMKQAPLGNGVTVEAGANWIHGPRARENGEPNPLWVLARDLRMGGKFTKWGNLQMYADGSGSSPVNADAEFEAFETASACVQAKQAANAARLAAGDGVEGVDPIDQSLRVSLRKCGWNPTTPVEHAVEWYDVEYEYAQGAEGVSTTSSVGNTFATHTDEDYMIHDPRGYAELATKLGESFLPPGCNTSAFAACEGSNLKLNSRVTDIEYTADGGVRATVSANGVNTTYAAKYLISTLPLGVLQRSIGRRNGAADVVRFHPALPEWKKDAIDSVNFEHYCKIFLQFNATFWDDTEIFMWADDTGHGWFPAWQNIERLAPGSNTLMVTVVGDQCVRAAAVADQATIDDAMYALRVFFPSAPEPLNAYINKWATDEWTYGSYSDYPVNTLPWMGRVLQYPVGRVFFAGEHTSPHFYGYVHGAYYTGLHTAAMVEACEGHSATFAYASGTAHPVHCPAAAFDRSKVFKSFVQEPGVPIPSENSYSYTYDEHDWDSYSYSSYEGASGDSGSDEERARRRERSRKLAGQKPTKKRKLTAPNEKMTRHRTRKFRDPMPFAGWGM